MADRLPVPIQAKKYLARKAIVETEAWDDLKHGEHSHAFTVAHSRNAAVLNDIFGALNQSLSDGESIDTFKKNMRSIMEKSGWYGRSDKTASDKSYVNWRTSLIYHVNMRSAYAAGRYREQVRQAELRPIWEYVSMLVGANRREDHIALHGKAFRADDPFWNEHYPPNGWGCECSVITHSESGAARDGIEILQSDAAGTPPPLLDRTGKAVDWTTFAPKEWQYNPGREAIAPNFRAYTNLTKYRMADGRTALAHVADRYREDMDTTRLTAGEFDVLLKRMSDKDYVARGINYQVGNLDAKRYEALLAHGIDDSKIMALDRQLYHGTGDKNSKQKIPKNLFPLLYKTLQEPERIYEESIAGRKNKRVFHFVTSSNDGKVIKVLLYGRPGMALEVTTMGWISDAYKYAELKKIW